MAGAGTSILSAYQILVKSTSTLRPQLQQLDTDIFPDGGPCPGQLIEITGNSNSAKSILLMEIMARAILPPHFGGKDSEVVFFDNDGKFKVPQFVRMLEKIAVLTGESTDNSEIKEAIEGSLKNLRIFSCYSPEEFHIAVVALDDLLVDNKTISMVAVDSLSAFAWLDSEEDDVNLEAHYKKAVEALQTTCQEFHLVGAYTIPSCYAIKCPGSRLADYTYELEEITEGLRGFQMVVSTPGYKTNKFFTVDTFGMNVIG